MTKEVDYENPWIYEGRPFTSDDIGDYYGFVYRITNTTTQRSYIGRKYFVQKRKPKGGKRRVTSESDWKRYYGSSDDLKRDIREIGKDNFRRESPEEEREGSQASQTGKDTLEVLKNLNRILTALVEILSEEKSYHSTQHLDK